MSSQDTNGAAFAAPFCFSETAYFLTAYFPKITVLEKWELAAM